MKLAHALYKEMSEADTWNTELFITNHRRVIDACPDTPLAIESCWRLSNLYLTGKAAPDRREVVKLMEYALERYPANPWKDRMSSRLVNTLQDLGDHQKLLEVCEAMMKKPGFDTKDAMNFALRAAQAAEALGHTDLAKQYYGEVLRRDPQTESVMAQVARRHVAALETTAPAQGPGK